MQETTHVAWGSMDMIQTGKSSGTDLQMWMQSGSRSAIPVNLLYQAKTPYILNQNDYTVYCFTLVFLSSPSCVAFFNADINKLQKHGAKLEHDNKSLA